MINTRPFYSRLTSDSYGEPLISPTSLLAFQARLTTFIDLFATSLLAVRQDEQEKFTHLVPRLTGHDQAHKNSRLEKLALDHGSKLLEECSTLAAHCGSLTKPRPGKILDPDPMQADSAGLTRFPIRPATFDIARGHPGTKNTDTRYKNI